jgi:hypothetical protein
LPRRTQSTLLQSTPLHLIRPLLLKKEVIN